MSKFSIQSAGKARPVAAPTDTAPRRPPPVCADASQRLIIEESGRPGVFVYALVDRATGEVVGRHSCTFVVGPDGQAD
ncbi:MAG TPA: hypothetical protein VG960_07755 [Caulobacteraceae bacterium]|nr:hypothetical protein [Caulobacteraceae bacterium]